MKSGKVIDLRGGVVRREPERPRPASRPPHNRDRRVSPIRVRRRKLRALSIAGTVCFVALVVYGVHWVSYIPRFTVASIRIEGAQEIDPTLVQSYAGSIIEDGSYHFLSRANIFLYPKEVVEKGIVASFPRIDTASATRDGILGRDLTITISERAPFALWCTTIDRTSCFAMDAQGFIFAESSATDTRFAQPYLFTGGAATDTPNTIGQTFAPGHVPGIIALLHLLTQNAGLSPVSVAVEDDQDFSIMFAQGFVLKASYGEDANALARNIQLVLGSDALKGQEENLEYIDLRFGNRVYYKLKGEDQTAV